ncbi:MAG: DUF4956 domain-containing protein [Anaerolineae bacterium]|nr:DUF4956 domain-containing protein [Anaerolineae bacterium]
MNTLIQAGLSFGLNFVIAVVIVRFIYYPRRRAKDYVFTFITFNTIIFFVLRLLRSADLSLGFGFGLFAIFSVLRYRTKTIPIREMTYLFVIIALPVINSILIQEHGWEELIVANFATIAVLYMLEKEWGFQYEIRKTVTYHKIDLIRPENWPQLLDDLQERTGLPIQRIEIDELDFQRKTVQLHIHYDAQAVRQAQITFTPNHHTPAGDYTDVIKP